MKRTVPAQFHPTVKSAGCEEMRSSNSFNLLGINSNFCCARRAAISITRKAAIDPAFRFVFTTSCEAAFAVCEASHREKGSRVVLACRNVVVVLLKPCLIKCERSVEVKEPVAV